MENLPFIYITLYPLLFWLIGLVVGGGLGWGTALLLRLLFKAWSPGRSKLIILPWRAVVFALLWLLWSPTFRGTIFVRELPVELYDFFQIGSSLLILAFMLTLALLIRRWFPLSLPVQLISEARTLAVAAIIVCTLAVAGNPSNNYVFIMRTQHAMSFERAILWQGWLFIFLAMLAFDLLLGLVQMLTALLQNKKK